MSWLIIGPQCWENAARAEGAHREHVSALQMDAHHQRHHGGMNASLRFLMLLVHLLSFVFASYKIFLYHRVPLRTNWTENSGHLSLILLPSIQLRLRSGGCWKQKGLSCTKKILIHSSVDHFVILSSKNQSLHIIQCQDSGIEGKRMTIFQKLSGDSSCTMWQSSPSLLPPLWKMVVTDWTISLESYISL